VEGLVSGLGEMMMTMLIFREQSRVVHDVFDYLVLEALYLYVHCH
jgi:hypothetical protein